MDESTACRRCRSGPYVLDPDRQGAGCLLCGHRIEVCVETVTEDGPCRACARRRRAAIRQAYQGPIGQAIATLRGRAIRQWWRDHPAEAEERRNRLRSRPRDESGRFSSGS